MSNRIISPAYLEKRGTKVRAGAIRQFFRWMRNDIKPRSWKKHRKDQAKAVA